MSSETAEWWPPRVLTLPKPFHLEPRSSLCCLFYHSLAISNLEHEVLSIQVLTIALFWLATLNNQSYGAHLKMVCIHQSLIFARSSPQMYSAYFAIIQLHWSCFNSSLASLSQKNLSNSNIHRHLMLACSWLLPLIHFLELAFAFDHGSKRSFDWYFLR
jgi:hypothetical protein